MADKKKLLPEYTIDDTGLLGGIGSFLAGGAKPRAALKGLLGGDTAALKGLLGELQQLADPTYMSKVNPMTTQEAMDMGMLALTTTGGKLADALPKTKYELAHELAQKNAVEMLGLPPNNTAMDRAKALGFDTPAYTGANISDEIDSMLPKSWFSKDPNYSSEYASVIPSDGIAKSPRVYPVMLKTGKQKINQYFGLYEDMEKALSKKNANTFTVQNVGGGTNNFYVPKESNQIRSINAAFDPARAHEADLLGNASPELLAYLTAGGLLGGGAYKYSQGDK